MADTNQTKIAVLEEKVSGLQDILDTKMESIEHKMDTMNEDINKKFDVLFSKFDVLYSHTTTHAQEVSALIERDRHSKEVIAEIKDDLNDHKKEYQEYKDGVSSKINTGLGSILVMLLGALWDFFVNRR